MPKHRSGCPINLATEALGDRWSMVVLRDVMFGDRRTFGDILGHSLEGIATNILGNRLKKLVEAGLLTSASDPGHKQRTLYSLTEKSIALLPVLIALGAWGRRFLPATPELASRLQILEEGGSQLQDAFMAELRERHLGIANASASFPVISRLQSTFALSAAPTSRQTL